jgi:hypothetical protein
MTYQIHRYPAELIDLMNLADGTRILVRLAANEELLSLARHAGFSGSCAVRGVIRLEKALIRDPVESQGYLTA